jgi:spore germination protein
MKSIRHRTVLLVITVATLFPLGALADGGFEISGWIPYWRSEKGVEDIMPHLGAVTEVNPFMYSVRTDGTLHEDSSLGKSEWVRLKEEAGKKNVRFVPTILWNDADAIHVTLSNAENRASHITNIMAEVSRYGLGGIDIDYEGKRAATRPYFSLFLKELNEALGTKMLVCTIEARTPLEDRYSSVDAIPADIEYANEYKDINQYCDRVRIMAYEQARVDLTLNKKNIGPYIPIADITWVEKVMRLALKDIAADKLIMGIPTYGYEYDLIFNGGASNMSYGRVRSFNPEYAAELTAKLGRAPVRNSAGELFIIYSTSELPENAALPARARILSWGDAVAAQMKINLAAKLGIRGVAIFKFDGEQDPGLWRVLEKAKTEIVVSTASSYSTLISGSDLAYGMRVERVRALQKFLNEQGYTVASAGGGSLGNETIFFGPATRSALIRFQKAEGIQPAVGYFGPITKGVITARF